MIKDGLIANGVLNLADVTRRKITVSNKEPSEQVSIKADAQTKITTAKVRAARELKEFKKNTEEYVEFLKNTALFTELGSVIEILMIDQVLKGVIEPTLAGNRILGMSQEEFNNLRRDMYKSLIDKYVDDAEEQGGE